MMIVLDSDMREALRRELAIDGETACSWVRARIADYLTKKREERERSGQRRSLTRRGDSSL